MPAFGRSLLAQWYLDPQITYLNHGTVGATPRQVVAVQRALQLEVEQQPSRFLLRELNGLSGGSQRAQPRLREAANQVAAFMGARGDDLVFVDNASTGINAVLRSLPLGPGDEILITTYAYGAVTNTAAFVARQSGARLVSLELPFPITSAGVILEAIEQAINPQTRLLIVDHITSETALWLPLEEITALAAARGVPVLVDGAHAPGAIPLNLPATGATWYVGNLHKWAMAPRGCGFLWALPQHQSGIHPPVISWGLDQGFTAEFDWVGTRDPSPYLAAPAGLQFLHQLGLDQMRQYHHGLVLEAAQYLTRLWQTDWVTPPQLVGSMALIPLPPSLGSQREQAAALRDALLYQHQVEIPVMALGNQLWVRLSAQVYNDMGDIERLGEVVDQLT